MGKRSLLSRLEVGINRRNPISLVAGPQIAVGSVRGMGNGMSIAYDCSKLLALPPYLGVPRR